MKLYPHKKARIMATGDQLRQIKELERIASRDCQDPIPDFSEIVMRVKEKEKD